MYLQADVHCYHCGDMPGIWEWRAGQPAGSGYFRTTRGNTTFLARLGGLRCGRCQGPMYLDDVRPRPQQRPPFVLQPGRRGRPAKSRELARLA
ncbi:MAG TPA: hypothetical protein VII06_34815 [Chloroflexota bacterium]|jgi:hypothetical protein